MRRHERVVADARATPLLASGASEFAIASHLASVERESGVSTSAEALLQVADACGSSMCGFRLPNKQLRLTAPGRVNAWTLSEWE